MSQLAAVRADAAEHGQQFEWSDFWHQFLASTFENWQSEFLQLIIQSVLLLALGHRLFRADQTASKDDVLELHRAIAAVRISQLRHNAHSQCPLGAQHPWVSPEEPEEKP